MRKVLKGLLLCTMTALAIIGLIGSGCADRKEMQEPKTHVEGWIEPSSAEFHGSKIEEANLISCTQCHGEDYLGGTSGVSCYKCHAGGPSGHPVGWLTQTSASFHGTLVAQRSDSSCAACHGTDFKGKEKNGVSCYLCHNGPSGHPKTGWLVESNPNFHGLDASSRGLSDCTQCHGEDFKGGWSEKSCSECHKDQSGHPSTGWLEAASANFHGSRMVEKGLSYCAGCHGADYKGGESGVSCYKCHNGPSGHPVESEWLNPASQQFHGHAVSSRGLDACAVCHGADYKGGISGVSCYDCHNGPSGHPDEAEWLNKTSTKFHGLAASSRGLPACAECHGDDFKGGASGQSCFACHTGPSGHPALGDWLNSASSKFHGVRVSQTGTQYCAGCHGADYKGGYAGVSCFTCHNGPSGHPTTWLNENAGAGFHGTVVQSQGVTDCQRCHGTDLSGGISGVACSDCH